MDWSKAKNVLIIAFIAINILMGYVLIVENQEVDATNSPDFIQQAEDLLNNKGIEVNTDIPNINPKLSALTVVYENMKPEQVNKNFFNSRGYVSAQGEELAEISLEDESVSILNKKLIIYESNSSENKYPNLNEEDVIPIAKEFLMDKGYNIEDIKISFIKKVSDYYYVEFSKIYNDIYLESAFTNIQINSSGVIKMERMWLDVKEEGENLIAISPAAKSILALLSMKEVYGKTIVDISHCYYFNPGKHDYIDDPLEAKQGRAIPAWRIQFEDGYKVIIDNY
ncbi:MAG: hypothetical protein GX787_00185 [Tissierellia bacterium]|jgi:hypothetical protein|nr:hypothetical protein [Tissierellia bacterium]